jgi:hypothetical protein
VQESLATVDEYRSYVSSDVVEMKVNEIALDLLEDSRDVLRGALKADKVIHVFKNGKVKKEADHLMRLKAHDRVRLLLETTRPKVPGIQLNQQINNNQNGDHVAPDGMSFEARLRRIREKRGLKDEADIIEMEVDDNEEQSVEDELGDIGIDLDEGDEDEGTEKK